MAIDTEKFLEDTRSLTAQQMNAAEHRSNPQINEEGDRYV